MHKQYKRKVIKISEDTKPMIGDIIINESRKISYLILDVEKDKIVQSPWSGVFGIQSRNDLSASVIVKVFDGRFLNTYDFIDNFVNRESEYIIFRQLPNFTKSWIEMINYNNK